jgi:BirA family biotin operon repressor/biotin-[acetyl-CoA-carboxylase] ligase
MTEPALPDFFRLCRFARIGSTNDEAKRLAEAGAPEGTLVWALEQDAGRGRHGRAWISPPGNLYLSLVLRPRVSAARAAQVGFAASLAVAEACGEFLPAAVAVRCKWPNDVLIGAAKVAGILLESRSDAAGGLDWLVLGIGVNLSSHPVETERPATSLSAAGADVMPDAMLAILAGRIVVWYETWRRDFAPVRAAWLARAHALGGEIRVKLPQGEISGRFAGLDEHGMLLLDGDGPRRRIAAAEIIAAA